MLNCYKGCLMGHFSGSLCSHPILLKLLCPKHSQHALVVLKSLSALKCRHNFCQFKGEDSPGQGKKQKSRRIIVQGVFFERRWCLCQEMCVQICFCSRILSQEGLNTQHAANPLLWMFGRSCSLAFTKNEIGKQNLLLLWGMNFLETREEASKGLCGRAWQSKIRHQHRSSISQGPVTH